MKLSDLKTGERAVIVKVTGHGGFRKRIVEMGFVKGKTVDVLLNAPFKDPVKYKIMDYEVSLRHSEAAHIEVVSKDEALHMDNLCSYDRDSSDYNESEDADDKILSDKELHDVAMRKRRVINVALVGNPNCGKTSLFNYVSGAHERVGNYSGVTVDAKTGHAFFEGYEFNVVDLPGTYSLSAYSPEELYVRKQIIDETPDVIINVIDSSNLERNLYLTTQLIDMHLRMVCALNMYDEAEKRGDNVDYAMIGKLFGVPMIPTVFKSGRGVNLLFHIIINMYEGIDYIDENGKLDPEVAREISEWHNQYVRAEDDKMEHPEDFACGEQPRNDIFRHIHINHGSYVEEGIRNIQQELKKNDVVRQRFSTRYLAIKLLENDKDVEEYIAQLTNAEKILRIRDKASADVLKYTQDDSETAIMDSKYGFIHGALKEAGYTVGNNKDMYVATHRLDGIITNKYFGFPIFVFIIWLMFESTFVIGQYPMEWIDSGVSALGAMISRVMHDGPLKDMIVDGIVGGVGAVVVFLPQILILYFFISFMEDSGYMARAAFIMDKLMHKMGLHGKSFIPLVMGFGCNVPAVLATRTIESRKCRLITMLIIPMVSCTARMPIYVMIIGTFFPVRYRSLIMLSIYVIGVCATVFMSKLFSRYIIKGDDVPFVMELPPYRFPTWKSMERHTWEKAKQYLRKMGGIILVGSILVWALGYFPHNAELSQREQQEQSILCTIGKTVEPLFRPQGFNWKLDVGLVAGITAKEIVASSLGVMYSCESKNVASKEDVDENGKYDRLHSMMVADGMSPLSAYCFLLFVLFYFPCVATIAAIKSETGSWKWAAFAALYTTATAWVVTAVVYQVGSLLL